MAGKRGSGCGGRFPNLLRINELRGRARPAAVSP